jgi:hypothetical protein
MGYAEDACCTNDDGNVELCVPRDCTDAGKGSGKYGRIER